MHERGVHTADKPLWWMPSPCLWLHCWAATGGQETDTWGLADVHSYAASRRGVWVGIHARWLVQATKCMYKYVVTMHRTSRSKEHKKYFHTRLLMCVTTCMWRMWTIDCQNTKCHSLGELFKINSLSYIFVLLLYKFCGGNLQNIGIAIHQHNTTHLIIGSRVCGGISRSWTEGLWVSMAGDKWRPHSLPAGVADWPTSWETTSDSGGSWREEEEEEGVGGGQRNKEGKEELV